MKLQWLSAVLFMCSEVFSTEVFESYTQALDKSSFFEQFTNPELLNANWIVSNSKKDGKFSYSGQWAIEPAYKYPGFEGDNGLVMKSPASHYAISYKFDEDFVNTDNDLVVQYEIKTQKGLSCAGTYIKLLDSGFDPKSFDNSTPFQVMFGPDKCGANDKVHLIINHENPITGVGEEKHLTRFPLSRSTKVSTLYTLILKSNADFEIRINGDVAQAGNLIEQPYMFEPTFNPPKEIVDGDSMAPSDWDDREYIEDSTVVKPDDYDELYLSPLVPDPAVPKPEGWLEDEPEYILDPFAEKPQVWDDEEDGTWEPPIIVNPKCEFASGCGKWVAPLIPNRNYKGPWIQPVIPNPNFKGEWEPDMIANPYYFEDKHPTNLKPIGGIGFELWAIEEDILFDNIYVGHSIKEAELIGNATFVPKFKSESTTYEINKPKAAKPPSPPPRDFDEIMNESKLSFSFYQIFLFFKLVFKREFLNMKDFYFDFNRKPLDTLIGDPLKAFVYAGVFIFGFTFFFGIINVVMYVLSSWISETKKTVETAKQNVDNDTKDEPKIVELKDDEHVPSSSSTSTTSTSQTTRVRRKH